MTSAAVLTLDNVDKVYRPRRKRPVHAVKALSFAIAKGEIVALRPDTGEYVWHYQTTPGETWDFTATQHLILATLKIDGLTVGGTA